MNYYAPVHEGLIAPKHYQQMGDAVWLYIYFLQKETRFHGKVKHGSPLTDTELADLFGVGEKQIRSWRRRLLKHDYIEAERRQYGYSYAIKNSKKFTAKAGDSDRPLRADVTTSSDRPLDDNSEIQIGLSEHSDRPLDARDSLHASDGEQVKGSGTKVLKNQMKKKDEERPSAATDSISEMEEKQVLSIWNYYLDATGKHETFTSERKRQIIARLREVRCDKPVLKLTAAIDMAVFNAGKNPKKEFLTKWHVIFGSKNMVDSLATEYVETENVPDAAELAEFVTAENR